MNRVVFALVTVLLLLSISSITGLIHLAKAEGGTISINADGSITPSSAPIHTADNITYTLTGNITASADGIVIERDNIVLNGAGYTVTGSRNGNDITLVSMGNVTINNMMITNNLYGICLESSSNCTLSGNDVSANNVHGIELDSSSNNTLSGNNVTANSYYGIYLVSSSGNTLSSNNITNDYNGIYIDSSSSNTLSGNIVNANNDTGIWLESDSARADNNIISGNNITANSGVAIGLVSSSNTTLSGNNITNNKDGIWLDGSSNNNIYHNNFVNNTNQVYTEFSTNIWDNGSLGNCWSDYLTKYPNATQLGSSGIWNTPYVIDANNTDYYPLTVQYVIPEFPSFLILSLFLIATLLISMTSKNRHQEQPKTLSS